MATLTTGYTWTSGNVVTPALLNQMVNSATATNIVNADISASADIAGSKLANLSVASGKIEDAAITQPKLGANVAGNGPAFRAHATAATTLADNDFTKIDLGAEGFDTGSFFDTTTSRFQPTVAGYYWFSGAIQVPTGADLFCAVLYKGTTAVAIGAQSDVEAYRATVADLIYLNGSTDFVEMRGYHFSGTTKTTGTGAANTYLAGCLMRAA